MISNRHLSNLPYLKNRSNFAHHVLINDHDRDTNNHGRHFLHISGRRDTTDGLEQLEILNEKRRNPDNIVNDITNFNTILLDKLVSRNVFI